MKTTTANRLILVSIVLMVLVGAYVYPALPGQVASHWNADGDVNGVMGRFWGVFLLPLLSVFLWLLFLVIPRIDPLRENIVQFRPVFNQFWVAVQVFLVYVFLLTLTWNMGARFDMTAAILPGVAVLIYVAGMLMERTKRSWFIGIRTPWTLSSDVVWEKTNRLGGKLFRWSSLFVIAGAVIGGDVAVLLSILPIVGSALWSMVYSYLEYRKLS